MSTRPARLAAAVLVTAAAGLTSLGAAPPASAATCSTSSGVTVVVDFKQLGGGVQGSCVADGAGKSAATLFPTAGFPIEYVQNEPGFVCRVSQVPTKDAEPCVDTPPADAYWGLWWSDGTSGTWKYANYGVAALKVPNGGYVALAWKKGDAPASPPGVAPATHPSATPTPTQPPSSSPTKNPSPSPSKSPTPNPTKSPPAGATTQAPSTSGPAAVSESASASESAGPTVSGKPTDSLSPSASETGAASDPPTPPVVQEPADPVDTSPVSDDEDGVPIAIVLALVVALFAASAGAVVLRRRQAP